MYGSRLHSVACTKGNHYKCASTNRLLSTLGRLSLHKAVAVAVAAAVQVIPVAQAFAASRNPHNNRNGTLISVSARAGLC
jgi:hypothetical protein